MTESFDYELIRSNRRSVSLEIKPNGMVIVRAPNRMKTALIDAFVASKSAWIKARLDSLPKFVTPLTTDELTALRQQAKTDLSARVDRYAPTVGVTVSRVTIRAQQTRWGSCSSKGNLNFNCLLMLTPEEIRDYVVVHELCHRRHLDHSAAFWAEVARVMPHWRQHRQWLKEHGAALLMKLPESQKSDEVSL